MQPSNVIHTLSVPVALLWPSLCRAQQAGAAGGSGVSAEYLWQVMLGLLFVLAMIFAIAWLVRRFGAGTLLHSAHMRVIGSLPLGARERAVLVEVGGQQLLLGVAPGRVSSLHVFAEPVVEVADGENLSDFGRRMREVMQKGRGS